MYFYVDIALGKHYYIYMLTQKTKAPQSADNTLKGSNCAIAHTATYKAIVSQSPMKGKAPHGVSRLQYHM
jgi:hypothetical protein